MKGQVTVRMKRTTSVHGDTRCRERRWLWRRWGGNRGLTNGFFHGGLLLILRSLKQRHCSLLSSRCALVAKLSCTFPAAITCNVWPRLQVTDRMALSWVRNTLRHGATCSVGIKLCANSKSQTILSSRQGVCSVCDSTTLIVVITSIYLKIALQTTSTTDFELQVKAFSMLCRHVPGPGSRHGRLYVTHAGKARTGNKQNMKGVKYTLWCAQQPVATQTNNRCRCDYAGICTADWSRVSMGTGTGEAMGLVDLRFPIFHVMMMVVQCHYQGVVKYLYFTTPWSLLPESVKEWRLSPKCYG